MLRRSAGSESFLFTTQPEPREMQWVQAVGASGPWWSELGKWRGLKGKSRLRRPYHCPLLAPIWPQHKVLRLAGP